MSPMSPSYLGEDHRVWLESEFCEPRFLLSESRETAPILGMFQGSLLRKKAVSY